MACKNGVDVSQLSEERPHIPLHPDEYTPEWLTAALRFGGLHDVTVTSVKRSRIGEVVGLMSSTERLDVDYADGGAAGPRVIVLKRAADNAANRAVANTYHLYDREVDFYRVVAPKSSAYTPEVYYSDLNENGFVLLLEDLSAYQIGNQSHGATLEQAYASMTWMGRQHAAFWDAVDDPSLDFLPMVYPSYSSDALKAGLDYGWGPMVEIFSDCLPQHIIDLKDRYIGSIDHLFKAMSTPPLTVIHGDMRLDNLFFGRDGGQEELVAFDFQGALRGRAAQDLGYFMGGNLSIGLRRTHERDLIKRWHDTLVEGGVTGYDIDDAWYEYRLGVLYVWTLGVIIAGTLDVSNDRAKQWIGEMLRRFVAAIDDLDLLGLLSELEAA